MASSIPNGLHYFTDVVDGRKYIDDINGREWFGVSASQNGRKVQHYGFYYDYSTGKINTPAEPIPAMLQELVTIAEERCKEARLFSKFNQIIVNKYEPGQGIFPHIDNRNYGPVIACFTFSSGGGMVFQKGSEKYELYTVPNSLYIMSGDARNEWSHSMPARKTDTVNSKRLNRGTRISVTMRWVSQ